MQRIFLLTVLISVPFLNNAQESDIVLDDYRNKLTKNGYFIDLMPFSIGTMSDKPGMVIGGGVKMGNKFYSQREGIFRPGITVNYARMLLGLTTEENEFGNKESFFNLSPVGVGFATVTQFSENTGLEVNIDVMVNMIYGPGEYDSFGFILIPNIKYRYKAFSIGAEFGISGGILGDEAIHGTRSTKILSLTAGLKF